MGMRGPADPLPTPIRRILVAGASGSGKTTVCRALAAALDIPAVEIDSLYHGPDWIKRPTFEADVDEFSAGPAWITEWQYRSVKPMLLARADLLVWLDHSRWLVTRRVIGRTLVRRFRRQELWNGNFERSLLTFLTDRDHIVRWSWRSYGKYATAIPALLADPGGEQIAVVRLCGQRAVDAWLAGPVAAAARITRSTREVQSPFPPRED
jgi:adenylate kinase family enzyme